MFSILNCDVLAGLRTLESSTVQTCITSPPYYGLRDYGVAGQIGLEETPDAYVARLVDVFREVKRVLADDGSVWLNLGDSYAGGSGGRGDSGRQFHAPGAAGGPASYKHDGKRLTRKVGTLKQKDLIGIPWMVAFALRADGWYLRQDLIWHNPNPMPESVRDRCTKAHEYVFLLSKSAKYFYNADAVKEPAIRSGCNPGGTKYSSFDAKKTIGRIHSKATLSDAAVAETRNRRSVWTITPKPFKDAHFAVMPEALVEPCILAGSKPGDIVLDTFAGSGTVGVVALRHGRRFVGCELNSKYAAMARNRIASSIGTSAAAA